MTYSTEKIQLNIEELIVDIQRIMNIDDLYDALIAKGEEHEDVKDERIPYWAELWPSALAMSRYMMQSDIDFDKKEVLELGCGMGLPSIVAGKLGAAVTVTDYMQEAVDFARSNWELNSKDTAVFTTLDWRTPPKNVAADIVIAADIAYEARNFDYIPHAFHTLCKPDGVILLSEPNRAFAIPFLKALETQGFQVKKTLRIVSLFDQESKVNIFELRRKI